MDLWAVTVEARRSILSTFEQLDDEQLNVPSLSEGWTVKEVLAHLVLAARPPARRYVAAVARARGNFDQANHALAVADADQSVSTLIADYSAVLDSRFAPPGWPVAAPLSDIVLHSLDVRVPLGLSTDRPAEHYEPVMGLLFSRIGRSFTHKGRPSVSWVADDHDWISGTGAEVRGAMADLALAAAGRSARIDRLHGDGLPAIRSWLG